MQQLARPAQLLASVLKGETLELSEVKLQQQKQLEEVRRVRLSDPHELHDCLMDSGMNPGLGEADANQNNGCISQKPAVTDSMGAEPWIPASTADPDATIPRPHLVRLFSRDAPGREDNTFKERPSESDELQTIQEHSGAASECGSESPEQDLE
ncbi:myelin basic protein-like [Brachionichthys hirsutus]|uniref:myelin basic protein-like n=1 Tax=Brachionichthys hirsutus TaxID=412623 RepID=UPI0036043ED7